MNKSTSKLKNLLNKYCFKRKFEQNSVSYLTSLAPKVITDEEGLKKISPYLETLKEAIDSGGRDITNIAITGTYGSGKSTVLKTFQYHNDNYKYLNISLASFKDIEEPTSNNDTTETKAKESLERRLEISILQQIFYRVKHSETPDSRFKRIINIPWWQLLITSLCVVLWIFALLSAIKFNYFESLNPITWSRNWSFDWIVFITFLIIVLGVGFLFYKLISVFVNSRINKVNIKGELELGSRIDKSVFNEYLEEIFYFFEKTKFNVVVIEDIDRFSTTEIFTKLRELNTLINNSDLIKRKVVFIYAIRDEVFKDKLERVKFFDFIIPIIPFINPTNANEQLTTLIDKKLLSNELSKNFTNDLVSFIDDIDMRLLINIFNEYLIYKGCLENSSLVQENLFAIITYKNLFPEDFGKLQKREGILYEFISRKPLYISEIINKIDKRINDKEEKIELIQNELDISIRELRSIYLMAFKSLFPNAISFYLDKEVSFNEMLNDDNFQKLQSLNEIKYVEYQLYDHYRYNKVTDKSSSKNFKSIEEYVNKNLTYSDRLKNLESKANNNIEILRKDIEKLKEEKREINSWDLKDILNQISIDEILECLPNTDNGVLRMDVDKVIFNNNIMRYVLWNGYINESYFDYITLFHEVNVTSKEFSFIRKVKVGVVSEFDVELNNIREVVKRIPSRYYQFESILNFNLVDFILEHSEEYHDELSSIMRLLSNEKDKSVEFIDKFIERNSDNVRIFIQKLCNKWTDFWNYIVEKSNYTEEKKNNYLKLIIECADLEDIENLNNSGKLSASIERESLFLNLFNKGDFEKLQSVVELLSVPLY